MPCPVTPAVVPMSETWLRPNRRAIWFGCVPPAAVALLGAWLAFAPTNSTVSMWRWTGALLLAIGLPMIALLGAQLRRPRIAYRDGYVLFYLRARQPIAVPVDIIEAFFLGQGSAKLPGRLERQESVNLVARISQRATEWARQDVKASLGNWCDGYVTIRGTWCEPLGTELVRRLNRRLKEVQTELDGSQ
jgi:hypothetical protein